MCLEASPEIWGPDPVLYQDFAIKNKNSFPIRKTLNIQKSGRFPRSRQDLETPSTSGPQTWQRDEPSLPTALLAGFSTRKGYPFLFPLFGIRNTQRLAFMTFELVQHFFWAHKHDNMPVIISVNAEDLTHILRRRDVRGHACPVLCEILSRWHSAATVPSRGVDGLFPTTVFLFVLSVAFLV